METFQREDLADLLERGADRLAHRGGGVAGEIGRAGDGQRDDQQEEQGAEQEDRAETVQHLPERLLVGGEPGDEAVEQKDAQRKGQQRTGGCARAAHHTFGGHQVDHAGEQQIPGDLDVVEQRLQRVAGLNGHAGLGEDRAGLDIQG